MVPILRQGVPELGRHAQAAFRVDRVLIAFPEHDVERAGTPLHATSPHLKPECTDAKKACQVKNRDFSEKIRSLKVATVRWAPGAREVGARPIIGVRTRRE